MEQMRLAERESKLDEAIEKLMVDYTTNEILNALDRANDGLLSRYGIPSKGGLWSWLKIGPKVP